MSERRYDIEQSIPLSIPGFIENTPIVPVSMKATMEQDIEDMEGRKRTILNRLMGLIRRVFNTGVTRVVEWGYLTGDDHYFADTVYSTAEWPMGHPDDAQAMDKYKYFYTETEKDRDTADELIYIMRQLALYGALAYWRVGAPFLKHSPTALIFAFDLGVPEPGLSSHPNEDDHLMVSLVTHPDLSAIEDEWKLNSKVQVFNQHFRDNPMPCSYGEPKHY